MHHALISCASLLLLQSPESSLQPKYVGTALGSAHDWHGPKPCHKLQKVNLGTCFQPSKSGITRIPPGLKIGRLSPKLMRGSDLHPAKIGFRVLFEVSKFYRSINPTASHQTIIVDPGDPGQFWGTRVGNFRGSVNLYEIRERKEEEERRREVRVSLLLLLLLLSVPPAWFKPCYIEL